MDGKVAVVTGAARGIGEAIAIQLADDGFDLAICDVDLQNLKLIEDRIKKKKRRCISFKLNISERSDVFDVMSEIFEVFGSLDVIVTNAGIVQVKPIIEITEQDLEKMFSLNVFGTFYCIQAA